MRSQDLKSQIMWWGSKCIKVTVFSLYSTNCCRQIPELRESTNDYCMTSESCLNYFISRWAFMKCWEFRCLQMLLTLFVLHCCKMYTVSEKNAVVMSGVLLHNPWDWPCMKVYNRNKNWGLQKLLFWSV